MIFFYFFLFFFLFFLFFFFFFFIYYLFLFFSPKKYFFNYFIFSLHPHSRTVAHGFVGFARRLPLGPPLRAGWTRVLCARAATQPPHETTLFDRNTGPTSCAESAHPSALLHQAGAVVRYFHSLDQKRVSTNRNKLSLSHFFLHCRSSQEEDVLPYFEWKHHIFAHLHLVEFVRVATLFLLFFFSPPFSGKQKKKQKKDFSISLL